MNRFCLVLLMGISTTWLASCTRSGDQAVEGCSFFDSEGSRSTNLEIAYTDPEGDAARIFKRSGMRIAVVRNVYGKTVTPLISSLDPVRQEDIESIARPGRGQYLLKKALKWSDGDPRFLFLQDDVRMKERDGPYEINLLDVDRPCHDDRVFQYAQRFNTQMIRLAFEQHGERVDF